MSIPNRLLIESGIFRLKYLYKIAFNSECLAYTNGKDGSYTT